MPRGKRARKGDYKYPETIVFLNHKLKGVLTLLGYKCYVNDYLCIGPGDK